MKQLAQTLQERSDCTTVKVIRSLGQTTALFYCLRRYRRFAAFKVKMSIWLLHLKSSQIVTPRILATLTLSNWKPFSSIEGYDGGFLLKHDSTSLRQLPTVTVQLNIDQSLKYQNDLAFRFLMLKNLLKIMKTSFCICKPRN